ncbi:MAG: N-acetylmuramoyl-L-alanine amidase [Pseudomonadota bacterium]
MAIKKPSIFTDVTNFIVRPGAWWRGPSGRGPSSRGPLGKDKPNAAPAPQNEDLEPRSDAVGMRPALIRDPRDFQFDLPPEQRPLEQSLNEKWLPQAIARTANGKPPWVHCTSDRPSPYHGSSYTGHTGKTVSHLLKTHQNSDATPPTLSAVDVIVVHATAGSSTLGAFSVMQEGRASYHWLVPDENEAAHENHVWATAPERRAAWHVRNNCSHPAVCNGAKRLNGRSLGIEIVNAQNVLKAGPDHFSDWQIEATAAIVRYAWAKYPNLKHVVSHARLDPKRRTDPGEHFPWERFQSLVLEGSPKSER